jgi:basic membrane protein A
MISIGRGRVGRIALSASAACLLLTGISISAAGSAGAGTKYQKTLACEVTDTGGINDRSFNASAYLGLQEAVKVAPKFIKKEVQSTPSTGTESTYETEIGRGVERTVVDATGVGDLAGQRLLILRRRTG